MYVYKDKKKERERYVSKLQTSLYILPLEKYPIFFIFLEISGFFSDM